MFLGFLREVCWYVMGATGGVPAAGLGRRPLVRNWAGLKRRGALKLKFSIVDFLALLFQTSMN